MSVKKLESMTETQLIRYVNDLQRSKNNHDDAMGEFIPSAGNPSTAVEIIRELTNAKEMLKRFKRKALEPEEQKKIIKQYMGFECAGCNNMYAKQDKITIDNKSYCRDCAKDAL